MRSNLAVRSISAALLWLNWPADTLRIGQPHTPVVSPREIPAVLPPAAAPPPYQSLTGFDTAKQSITYEVNLSGRQLGFELREDREVSSSGGVQTKVVVQQVKPTSPAARLGVASGDELLATSATVGDSMWAHSTLDSARSAVSTRFVMRSDVRVRLARRVSSIDPALLPLLKVPQHFTVQLIPPATLTVRDHPGQARSLSNRVVVADMRTSGEGDPRVRVGDEVVGVAAAWGSSVRPVTSAAAFMDIMARRGAHEAITVHLRRMVPLLSLPGFSWLAGRGVSIAGTLPVIPLRVEARRIDNSTARLRVKEIEALTTATTLSAYVTERVGCGDWAHTGWSSYEAHKLITTALQLGCPAEAVSVFKSAFGFTLSPANTAAQLLQSLSDQAPVQFSAQSVTSVYLPVNNAVCTSAVKAYGRMRNSAAAVQVWHWLECTLCQAVDAQFLSAVLHVCAKAKKVQLAERIFWSDFPSRNLSYATATVNSMIFLYAKLKKADEALRVYQDVLLARSMTGNIVTYGALVKALFSTAKPGLHATAMEIVRGLPSMGLQPSTELFNQLLEHSARTHNHREAKRTLRLMARSHPPVPLDAISYAHVIHCFADSRKPRSALAAFRQMRLQGVAPTCSVYMGVLKALVHLRDGFEAAQVINEMLRDGVCAPTERHYATAMFACVASGSAPKDGCIVPDLGCEHCHIAEALVAQYMRHGGSLDAALCALWMRALLQQGKWSEGQELLSLMRTSPAFPKPESETYNAVLLAQVQAQRWLDARETLHTILSLPEMARHGKGRSGTCLAITYALGSHSRTVRRRQWEDRAAALAREDRGSPPPSMSAVGLADEPLPSTDAVAFAEHAVREIARVLPGAAQWQADFLEDLGKVRGLLHNASNSGGSESTLNAPC